MDVRKGATADWGGVRQLGYVVEDLDASLKAWTEQLGVGPWLVIRNVPLQSVFRGRPSTPRIDLALGYRGDVQIELIHQTNDAASPYLEFIQRRQFGLHHIAFLVDPIDEAVRQGQASGLEMICDINMPNGGRYVYFASPVPGEQSCIELLEATPAMRAMFEQGMQAAAGWDGKAGPMVIDFAAMAGS